MVEVTLGPEKMAEISQVELRQRCREWAEKYVPAGGGRRGPRAGRFPRMGKSVSGRFMVSL